MASEEIVELLDLLLAMRKIDLKTLRDALAHDLRLSKEKKSRRKTLPSLKAGFDKDKVEVIGALPFLLLSKEYFPTNDSVARFAKENGIRIPKGHKTRPELIGFIVIGIAELQPASLSRLNKALRQVLRKAQRHEIGNFLSEWDRAIRGLEFRE